MKHENGRNKPGYSEEKMAQTKERQNWDKIKILNIIMLALGFVAMGMTHTIQYTTIPDMRIRMSTTAQQLSYSMSAGTAGGLLGSPAASLVDRYARYSNAIIAACLCGVGLGFACYPFSPYVWTLGVFDFIFSFGWALYQGAAHSVISFMCGTEGGPARFAIHLGYPIGAVLGPLLAYPFVSKPVAPSQNSTTASSEKTDNFTISRYQSLGNSSEMDTFGLDTSTEGLTGHVEDTSTIEYAFLITSLVVFLNAAYFIVMQLCTSCELSCIKAPIKPRMQAKSLRSFRQVLSPGQWAEGDTWFGVMIVGFAMVIFILECAAMKGSQEYLVTYAVDSGMFTNQRAALLNSLTFGAGTLARALAIVVSRYLDAPHMLLIEVHGQFLFGLLCLIFGTHSKLALWILAPGLGFFRELIWPTGFTWTDHYIVLFGVVVGWLNCSAALLNMALIPMQGYLYDNVGIESIFHTTVFFGFLLCVALWIMTYVASKKGGRKARALKVYQNETVALNSENNNAQESL